MKISIERSSFLNSLSHVQNIVEKRNTVPILSNILITTNKNSIVISATDMDIFVTEKIDSNVIEEGAVTVSAHTIYDIVRKIAEGNEIELISNDGNKLSIRSGNSKFSLSCLPKDDFPKMEDISFENEFTINSEELKKIINRTKFAMSNEEARYYLNGIYFHAVEASDKKMLRTVSTDGHRLARFETEIPDGADNIPGIIIPKKTINEIGKLIDEFSGDVSISLDENKIVYKIDNIILSSKLIDGSFPDYEKVIPKNNDKIFTVDSKLIYEAVDRVSTVSSETSKSVKFKIINNILTLSSNSVETGSGAEDIDINYNGENIEIGYNAKYLLEIINQIEGENVEFKLFDSSSPSIIGDPNDKKALYILMPMRV